MRSFGPSFAYANQASEKYDRWIIAILFDTGSIYLTSHPGISGVPGIVIENTLQDVSAVSQRIYPDEGRSEIGALSFNVVDVGGAVTAAFRAKHVDAKGLRNRPVKFYIGYSTAAFTEYQLFQTQVIRNAETQRGAYSIKCADITREQRKEIFDPKRTTLTASITATDATIPVANTLPFHMVAHGAAWSDAPSATVGYIRIADEIIRYTSTDGANFLGCTRGALNTRAVPHTVDLTSPADQRTRVDEFIYLELPAVKMVLAILTGALYGEVGTLPDHWHLGIDAAQWVRTSDFTKIGTDLWNPGLDSVSFIARFAGLKKTDGKRFLETELYQMLGCFPVIYADGAIGIKRMNAVLADAPYVDVFDESNVVSWSALQFDMDGMCNSYQVDWNFDNDDKATRSTRLVDSASIAMHGSTPPKQLQFRGLYGSRHTDSTVRARIAAQRDRYAHPPERLSINALPSQSDKDIGDIVRVRLPQLRDFMGTAVSIDRSFEIQQARFQPGAGELTFELFGSTGRASDDPPDSEEVPGGEGPVGENSLPDAFYDGAGTDLSTVVPITVVGDVGVIDPGTYDLAGHANMTNDAAVYYYLGDLELPDGATLNIADNVQIRVRGFFTQNGDINGIAKGLQGSLDSAQYGTSSPGTPAFFGSSRGMDGVAATLIGRTGVRYSTVTAGTTTGLYSQVPYYTLQVVPGAPPTLQGLPTDLRGTSGGAGGKLIAPTQSLVASIGGEGGDGGSGLLIISRGFAAGLSATINLSGGNSATPAVVNWDYGRMYPGAGGAGAPGALLILLDGSQLSLPDLSAGRFVAATGVVGAPLANTMNTPAGGVNPWPSNAVPLEGYASPAMISGVDLSNSAYRIQYIPAVPAPAEDAPSGVPPASALTTTSVPNGVLLQLGLPDFDQFDSATIYAAATNDRTGATQVAQVKASAYVHPLATATTRYYWVQLQRGALVSAFYPTSSTGGVSGTAG